MKHKNTFSQKKSIQRHKLQASSRNWLQLKPGIERVQACTR